MQAELVKRLKEELAGVSKVRERLETGMQEVEEAMIENARVLRELEAESRTRTFNRSAGACKPGCRDRPSVHMRTSPHAACNRKDAACSWLLHAC